MPAAAANRKRAAPRHQRRRRRLSLSHPTTASAFPLHSPSEMQTPPRTSGRFEAALQQVVTRCRGRGGLAGEEVGGGRRGAVGGSVVLLRSTALQVVGASFKAALTRVKGSTVRNPNPLKTSWGLPESSGPFWDLPEPSENLLEASGTLRKIF